MKREYKRKKYFIDKPFQTKFIFKFCIIVIVSSLMIGGLILFLSQRSTTVAIENTKVVVKNTADFILPVVLVTIVVVSFFSSLVVLVVALLISHKISGPLFRIKREIGHVEDGDLTPDFQIRAKDQLKEIAKSLGDMCSALRQKHTGLKEKISELKDYIKEKGFSASQDEKARLTEMAVEIENILKRFKV